MAVHGYITHAAHNRRCTAWLVLAYIVSFEVIGAFVLTMPLLMWDHEHTILSNPIGYAVRYALPIAALTGFMFWWMYRGHARAVMETLGVRIVTRQDEPRFVAIAEEQCTALGVRLPRFGIIDTSEPNAVTVGEGPTAGLIAVTRGLLDRLDDDELAAVLAHEASHIRHGDTKLLAANHALMRTAVILRMNNPLRFEDWRQMIIPLAIPPMLLVLLAGGAATAMSMRLARAARRSLKLGRDYVADGEAIRVTHFPEALIGAINKIGGRGVFHGSARVEGLLFDGPADHDGGSHPSINDRLDAIATLGQELMNPARSRRDSRGPAQPQFGRRPRAVALNYPLDASGKPLEKPRPPATNIFWLYLTDRETFREWHNACIAWEEWQLNERRNLIGLAPRLIIPLIASCAVALYIYWPKDGNLKRLIGTFNPAEMVDIARMVNSGPFCSGPSYPDGKCPGAKDKPVLPPANAYGSTFGGQAASSGTFTSQRPAGNADKSSRAPEPPTLPSNFMPILLFALVVIGILKPKLLRRIFGHVEPKQIISRPAAPDPITASSFERASPPPPPWRQEVHSPAAREFGRRKA
ncbi:M48 family metalloprotease [Bradyrhizobium sp.]|uniref:M48 family metalloprotease n=1 Tax=Bradyrhizobium sp. TaxID=376 RepID=UPI002B679E38|nr:M48 family metalloprotease [Bradyrhizobium sp.]HMM91759.1 M48 family metalloprotease [Bradyrhizobium sp.]